MALLNRHLGADYRIIEFGDAPDVRCQNSKGEGLNLEITLTEDRPRDIQAALGRSNHKSIEALAEHNKRVAEGKEKPQFNALSGNVLNQIIGRIKAKLDKTYGPNTALLVRDTSGVDWDWEFVIDEVKEEIKAERNPFDKGIWILNLAKTKLYQVT